MQAETSNLLDFNHADLEAFFLQLGHKSFRATQVLKWIYQHGVDEFSAMTNLSLALRTELVSTSCISLPPVESEQTSADGTIKWLVRVDETNCVETVYIPEAERGTLCVSSQIGCPLDCSFCATGKQGFNRNLGVAEIIGQVLIAARRLGHGAGHDRRITNIVLMGMGEPLLNFDNVVKAMDLMMDDNAFGFAKKRITLSTAGVVPGIERLRERSAVSLAVSLHAPSDALRDELVPLNRTYPLRQLLAACKRFAGGDSRNAITFEYVMLDGVNDAPEHAQALARCLSGIPAKVNLIPFNPIAQAPYHCSPAAVIDRFRDILIDAGLITITRKTRGDDIDAACGQLVGKVTARGTRHRRQAFSATAEVHP